MKIELNGKLVTTAAGTLAELIKEQEIDRSCIASAMNGEFIPRNNYDTTILKEGMKVEILSPMQGG